MDVKTAVSRRGFMGGVAAALGYIGVRPDDLWAQTRSGVPAAPRARVSTAEYDAFAKLANNENPYGPPESVMKAMTEAFKYSNRYCCLCASKTRATNTTRWPSLPTTRIRTARPSR